MMRDKKHLKKWLLTKEQEFCQIFSKGEQAIEQSSEYEFPRFFSLVLFEGLLLQVFLMPAIPLFLLNVSVNETDSSNLV